MNNKLYTDALTALFRSIEAYISRKLSKAAFDRTVEGTITAVDNTRQLCTVQINGIEHQISSSSPSFTPGEKVSILLPCNCFHRAKILNFENSALDEKLKAISSELSSLKSTLSQKITGTGIANNLSTTAAGYALDARQGNLLNQSISALKNTITGSNTWDSAPMPTYTGKNVNATYDKICRMYMATGPVPFGVSGDTDFILMTLKSNNNTTSFVAFQIAFYVAANEVKCRRGTQNGWNNWFVLQNL